MSILLFVDKEKTVASEKASGNAKITRVLEAARTVFLRYGFRRVTMQDIADEAGMSRPALYLVFPNKEEVFFAAIRDLSAEMLRTIREGMPEHKSLESRLQFAFEAWTIQSYAMMQSSPDARDLIECVEQFARETIGAIEMQFQTLLAEIFEPFAISPVKSSDGQADLDVAQVVRLLAASAHGCKDAATSVEDLRAMIYGMITLTIAALRN
jgi:AcrR family transcriptional regulator